MTPDERIAVVRTHMESENRHDFDTTIATFSHPRYELMPTGEVHDGEEAVRRYFATTRAAFPDQRNEPRSIHDAGDFVVAEFDLLGTHEGPLGPFEPTGRSFRCPMVALFFFDDERIVCERVYYDRTSILQQLGLL